MTSPRPAPRRPAHRTTSIAGDTRIDWTAAYELAPSLEVAYVWHAGQWCDEVGAGLRARRLADRPADHLGQGPVRARPRPLPLAARGLLLRRTASGAGEIPWYAPTHVPAFYARKPGSGPWLGDRAQSTIWVAASPKMSQAARRRGGRRVRPPDPEARRALRPPDPQPPRARRLGSTTRSSGSAPRSSPPSSPAGAAWRSRSTPPSATSSASATRSTPAGPSSRPTRHAAGRPVRRLTAGMHRNPASRPQPAKRRRRRAQGTPRRAGRPDARRSSRPTRSRRSSSSSAPAPRSTSPRPPSASAAARSTAGSPPARRRSKGTHTRELRDRVERARAESRVGPRRPDRRGRRQGVLAGRRLAARAPLARALDEADRTADRRRRRAARAGR